MLFLVLNIPNLFVSQYSRKSHISLFRKERIGPHHSLLISYQSYPGENLEHFKLGPSGKRYRGNQLAKFLELKPTLKAETVQLEEQKIENEN